MDRLAADLLSERIKSVPGPGEANGGEEQAPPDMYWSEWETIFALPKHC